jgi:nucleotide-binding universal stress UspA family protein
VLVFTVEPVLPDGGFLPDTSTSPIVEIQNERRIQGEARVAELAKELEGLGVACTSVTRLGNPAHEITVVAREQVADLVVAGSQHKGSLESFIMGSVTRALVSESRLSILVGKSPLKAKDKLDAVFATDHSDYATQCLDLLLRQAPKGLDKITVVSADTSDPGLADVLRTENPEGLGPEQVLERKNEAVCARLRPIATSVDSIVLKGRVNDVLNAAMEQTRADLLILGAHGKGFLERIVMGSTAMYMVANAPWNVLVLRV